MSENKARRAVTILVLLLWGVVSLFPFYWTFISSLMPVEKIFSFPPNLFPKDPSFINFGRLKTYIPELWNNIWNSFVLAVSIPLANVFFGSLAGFAFAKYQFKGKNVLFAFIIFTMLIPPSVGFIPLFIEMVHFKLINTLWAIFLPGIVGAFGIFLFRQTIFSISNDLLSMAKIDGAKDFAIYRHIVVPLIMPMIVTQYILGFLNTWNDYLWPLIILRTPEKFTFPVALSSLQGMMFESPWGSIMAGATLLTIPSIFVFVTLSKYIIPDLMSGSIKE